MLNAKNSSKITKNTKLLIGLAAFLTLLYLMSFTKSCTSKDSRERIKTSLVNPKYKDSITSFELEDASGSLLLTNNGQFWTAGSLPASPERIQNLLENLTSIRNLYKISDKITQNSAFGLTNGTEFHLRYNTEDSFHELIFGNQDFSLSSRYLMTEKNTQVYEIDNTLDNFLSTSQQSWAEPFIISQLVLGKITANDIQRAQVINYESNHISSISDPQKLLDLRHGGSPDFNSDDFKALTKENPQITINLELGNKNEIILKIYKSKNENEFIVLTEYISRKDTAPVFTSASKISSWTYNKIKENAL